MTSPLNEEEKEKGDGEGKETSREVARWNVSKLEGVTEPVLLSNTSHARSIHRYLALNTIKVATQIPTIIFPSFPGGRGISQYNASCRESNISCLLGTGQDVLILLYIYELDSPVLYSHLQKSWVKSKETLLKVNFYFDVISPIFDS